MPLDSEGYYSNVGGNINGGWEGEEALHNGQLMCSVLIQEYGWTPDSVSAWLGAISYESALNPGKIEGNLPSPGTNTGVGWIQWTPSADLLSFADGWGVAWYLASTQYRKWELERTTTDSDIRQWFLIKRYLDYYHLFFNSDPPSTMDAFTHATLSQYTFEELSAQIVLFYTRPASWQDTDKWKRNAETSAYWYEVATGELPPIPVPVKKSKLPLWCKIKY